MKKSYASNPSAGNAERSEEQLIARAVEAVSQCRWVVGECAAAWTERYARGRTDADFAALIGLSADQVFQRRRVWERFSSVRGDYPGLKWSHFYAALNWDDAPECLAWAEEMKATVAEMKAWRRAQRGEDLAVDAVDEELVRFVPTEPQEVVDPAHFEGSNARGGSRESVASGAAPAVLGGVARQSGEDDYAPFRATAGSPPPRDEPAPATSPNPAPTAEQFVKRLSVTLERGLKLMTPEFRREFARLPETMRSRFIEAAARFASKVAELG